MSEPMLSTSLESAVAVVSLFVPPPSTFPFPQVEAFATAHDPIIDPGEDGHNLFTAAFALREAGVHLDVVSRNVARSGSKAATEEDNMSREGDEKPVTLASVRRARLRARLQSQSLTTLTSGPAPPGEEPQLVMMSRDAVLRALQQRKARFDTEIAREEEEVLDAFKRGLREIVLLGTNA